MKKSSHLLSGLLFFALSMLAMSPVLAESTPESIPGTTKVSAEQLIELLEQYDDLVLVDARRKQDHDAGWIEGSVSLPNTDTNPESLAKVIPSKSTPVLFYCNGPKCGRSVESCKIAVADGYTTVYWFRGGWAEWEEKGLPVAH